MFTLYQMVRKSVTETDLVQFKQGQVFCSAAENVDLNPTTYGILRFHQPRGAFWTRPRKQKGYS